MMTIRKVWTSSKLADPGGGDTEVFSYAIPMGVYHPLGMDKCMQAGLVTHLDVEFLSWLNEP